MNILMSMGRLDAGAGPDSLHHQPVHLLEDRPQGGKRQPMERHHPRMGHPDASGPWQLHLRARRLPRPLRIQPSGPRGGLSRSGNPSTEEKPNLPITESGFALKPLITSHFFHGNPLRRHSPQGHRPLQLEDRDLVVPRLRSHALRRILLRLCLPAPRRGLPVAGAHAAGAAGPDQHLRADRFLGDRGLRLGLAEDAPVAAFPDLHGHHHCLRRHLHGAQGIEYNVKFHHQAVRLKDFTVVEGHLAYEKEDGNTCSTTTAKRSRKTRSDRNRRLTFSTVRYHKPWVEEILSQAAHRKAKWCSRPMSKAAPKPGKAARMNRHRQGR
jgi:hypothetical protein